jgi:hypothetical protein
MTTDYLTTAEICSKIQGKFALARGDDFMYFIHPHNPRELMLMISANQTILVQTAIMAGSVPTAFVEIMDAREFLDNLPEIPGMKIHLALDPEITPEGKLTWIELRHIMNAPKGVQ